MPAWIAVMMAAVTPAVIVSPRPRKVKLKAPSLLAFLSAPTCCRCGYCFVPVWIAWSVAATPALMTTVRR
jgi:hypothetical protein